MRTDGIRRCSWKLATWKNTRLESAYRRTGAPFSLSAWLIVFAQSPRSIFLFGQKSGASPLSKPRRESSNHRGQGQKVRRKFLQRSFFSLFLDERNVYFFLAVIFIVLIIFPPVLRFDVNLVNSYKIRLEDNNN